MQSHTLTHATAFIHNKVLESSRQEKHMERARQKELEGSTEKLTHNNYLITEYSVTIKWLSVNSNIYSLGHPNLDVGLLVQKHNG